MSDRPPLIPSTFLPHLPRAQNSFDPLLATDLLAHIAILRELYIPPVHGGLDVRDCLFDEDLGEGSNEGLERRRRERRFSAGLEESMDGLGLDLDVDTPGGSSSRPISRGFAMSESDNEGLDDLSDGHDAEEESGEHLDPFERDWSEKWLNGVVRRSQGWLEEHEEDGDPVQTKEMECLLRDASAALAIMAGTSATGSLTRHLLFPLDPNLEPGLRALKPSMIDNPNVSPAARTFLSTLATSPTSPLTLRAHMSSSPTSVFSSSPSTSFSPNSPTSARRKGKRPAVPIILHDAPMSDHLSVGVQTWGSAILLGRRMAKHPDYFDLFDKSRRKEGIRILELGAGTGLLSILCRKLLDLKAATEQIERHDNLGRLRDGLIIATDFLPEVLANLKTCIDLNFPSSETTAMSPSTSISKSTSPDSGIHIAKLDWTTFPTYMQSRLSHSIGGGDMNGHGDMGASSGEEETGQFMDQPFDLVLASDCVYDPTHARMLRDVASWVLRLPDEHNPEDRGGVFHILSPIRPTFTPELESIDLNFPPHPSENARGKEGEGLGSKRGLRLGTKGGKRGMVGRKGEGRIDENAGYWWWEVVWA